MKCVQNEEELEEREKEILMLRKDRKDSEVEMEEKMKLISIREKERDEMIRQKERKIEEQLEAMNSLKNKHACLENEISEMRIVMESTREGLQKEQAKNDIKDSRIEVGIYICINSKIIDSQHWPEIFSCFFKLYLQVSFQSVCSIILRSGT